MLTALSMSKGGSILWLSIRARLISVVAVAMIAMVIVGWLGGVRHEVYPSVGTNIVCLDVPIAKKMKGLKGHERPVTVRVSHRMANDS